MGFTVTESIEARTQSNNAASRTYLVEWDGSGVSNTNTARAAAVTKLDSLVEDYSTGIERDLDEPDADPIAETERRLVYFLHGFPARSYQCDEVGETDGGVYRFVATWGIESDQLNQFIATEFIAAAVADPDDAEATYTSELSASAQGATIDYAPLAHLFVANSSPVLETELPWQLDIKYASPPFDLGSLNVEQPTADGELTLNGLSYSAPPIDQTVTLKLKAGSISADWASLMHQSAKRGVLNTDTMTVSNITYAPYTLLLSQFTIRYDNTGSLEVTIGFSTGYLTDVVFTPVSSGWQYGDSTATRYKTSLLDYFGKSFSILSPTDPTSPVTPPLVGSDRLVTVSSLDYVWSFMANTLDGLDKVSYRKYVCIHRVWGEATFGVGGLLGVNTL